MEENKVRERSSSLIVIIDGNASNCNDVAFKLVRTALDGDPDPHIVNIIEKRIKENTRSLFYPDLHIKRIALLSDVPTNRSNLTDYVIRELADDALQTKSEKERERRQKYIIAAVGAGGTLVSTLAGILATYFSSKG